jgi:hypothetical protein
MENPDAFAREGNGRPTGLAESPLRAFICEALAVLSLAATAGAVATSWSTIQTSILTQLSAGWNPSGNSAHGPLDKWVFIPFAVPFGIFIVLGAALARTVIRDAIVGKWIQAGYFAALSTVAMGALQVGLLGLEQANGPTSLWANLVAITAVILVSSAVPAAVAAVIGVTITAVRLWVYWTRSWSRTGRRNQRDPQQGNTGSDAGESFHLPLPLTGSDLAEFLHRSPDLVKTNGASNGQMAVQRARWLRGYQIPLSKRHPAGGEVTGICLSGGGIRAASFALGALQAKKMRDSVMPAATYLVSVSGGGYTAGAFQQALTDAVPPQMDRDDVLRDPTTALLEGTAEEDHIRRHASYIADSPSEVLVALGLLGRHLLLTLLVLFGPAVVLGVAVGTLYRVFPVTELDAVAQSVSDAQAGSSNPVLSFPFPRQSAVWAIAIVLLLATLCWLTAQFFAARRTRGTDDMQDQGEASKATTRSKWYHSRLTSASERLTVLAGGVVAVTFVLPALIWISAWVLELNPAPGAPDAAPILAVMLTYVASLASLLWRRRTKIKDELGGASVPAAVPRGFLQMVLVIVALTVLGIGWLLLFGGSAITVLDANQWSSVTAAACLLGLVVALGGFVDETTLSLHPFYRRRLASAFAVRAVKRNGNVVAMAYAPSERTTLSTYGRLAEDTPFPEVIFAASATVGDRRTPPGSNRVSFSFSSDWVGGPDLGYVATSHLQQISSARLQRDLTVQGAVALSGAALASSLGGQGSSWVETLYAVTGVRLGAWMPNPLFLAYEHREGHWSSRDLPRVRRMSYLLRELFGIHPAKAPLLQVTDGGFYDNLGLIELFRRRCTRIYCVDASGDNPPPVATLSEVLTLAYQELGVKVHLDDSVWESSPGSSSPEAPKDALKALNPRLAKKEVITGTFEYPGGPDQIAPVSGFLVVAKASLNAELPYPLLAYAMNNPTFPHDSTSDQWFDDAQYAAYTGLGRELGEAAARAMEALVAKSEPKEAEKANYTDAGPTRNQR